MVTLGSVLPAETEVMVMRRIALSLLSSVTLLLPDASSFANDSSAELSVGGLVFTHTADVSLESEDLAITPDLVVVRYRFLNQTPKPVSLTVAFPVPDIDLADGDNYSIPSNDPANFLGFETKVDGKPIDFTIHQSALVGTKDISAALKKIGVPLLPIGPQQNSVIRTAGRDPRPADRAGAAAAEWNRRPWPAAL